MNTEYVKYFIVACDCGSIQEASKQLFISAQGLGAGIHRLEKSIGIELLEYDYRGVVPTEFGRKFYDQAITVCRELDRLEQMTREYHEAQKCTVTVGTVGDAKFTVGLQNGIARYQEKYPNSDISGKLVVKEDVSQLIKEVRSGNIDIAVYFHTKELEDLHYRQIKPYSKLHLLINQEHPMAKQSSIRMEDLKDLFFVAAAPHPPALYDPFFSLIVYLCEQRGFTPKPICFSTENPHIAKLIDKNVCAMFVREIYSKTILPFCSQAVLVPIEPETEVACSFIWRKKALIDDQKKQFFDTLIQYSESVF